MRFTEITIIIGVLWLIELYNSSVGHSLGVWGIYPRSVDGLKGIFVWPLLHANMAHLVANTLPIAILSWFILLRGFREYIIVTIGITIVAGIAIWIFARPAVHIGASGLIFGYFGFLVAAAWYEKSFKSVVFAFLTVFLYGGIVWGIFPQGPQISWEGHFFGLLAGIILASYLEPPELKRRRVYSK